MIYSGLQSTPVMLSKKNILVTHSVLRLCRDSGAILLTSWLTVLTTLQHLCWVCNIVPKSSASADYILNTSGKLANVSPGDGRAVGVTSSSTTVGSGDFIMIPTNPSTSVTLSKHVHSEMSELSLAGKSSQPKSSSAHKSVNGATNGGVMGVVVEFGSSLSNGVTRLIEMSTTLDDVSLHHVINALTNMSQEAMEIAYLNRVLLINS